MFKRHRDADRRLRSAVTLIKAVLSSDLDLYPAHRRDFLRRALGKLTESEGASKHKTRFRSEAPLAPAPGKLQHELVFRRELMVGALLKNPEQAEAIVARAVGCVVTKAEHARLDTIGRADPGADGWERYRRAGIVVIDTATGQRMDFT